MNNTIYYVASRGNGKGLTSLSHLCKLLENGYEVKAIKGGLIMACKGRIWNYKYDDIGLIDIEKSKLINISPYNKCELKKCGYYEKCQNFVPYAFRNFGLKKEE